MWGVKSGRGDDRPDGVLDLQSATGNRAVADLINIQRHSIDNAPPPPEKEGDEEEVIQGLWNHDRTRPSTTPAVQRKKGPGSSGAKKVPKIKAAKPLGKITIPATEMPADGRTFRARVAGARGRTLTWSIFMAPGAKVDAASGRITRPTSVIGGLEQAPVLLRVTDSAGYASFASFQLVDAKVFKARKEFPKYIARSQYRIRQFRTFDKFGRFDVTYKPKAKQVHIDMRIAFIFRGIRLGRGRKHRAAQRAKQDAYAKTVLSMAKAAWHNKFKIENVREPKSVWGNLGPVEVHFNPTRTYNRRRAHFKLFEKSHVTADSGVNPGGTAEFYKGATTDTPNFNPGTRTAELDRLKKISPDLWFDPMTSNLTAASKKSAAFLGLYLKRMNNPAVKIAIKAYAPDDKLATARNKAATAALKAGGFGAPHTRTTAKKVDKKNWEAKVELTPSIPAAWKNVQATTAHEIGHMLGLDDEYVRAGWKIGDKMNSWKLAEAALGKKWADTSHRITDDSSSLMEGGNDLRIQHYVTIWDALAQASAKRARYPTPRFGQADWKLIG